MVGVREMSVLMEACYQRVDNCSDFLNQSDNANQIDGCHSVFIEVTLFRGLMKNNPSVTDRAIELVGEHKIVAINQFWFYYFMRLERAQQQKINKQN